MPWLELVQAEAMASPDVPHNTFVADFQYSQRTNGKYKE
jgi:hypothetical protein